MLPGTSCTTSPDAGNPSRQAPVDIQLPAAIGAAWGDLPGEVRTRLTQDWRARYGEQYEAIIQRYFRNLSQTPRKK